MNKYAEAVISDGLNLKVDDLLAEGVSEEAINNLDEKQFQKLANKVSNIMFATFSDAVGQACREFGIIPTPED